MARKYDPKTKKWYDSEHRNASSSVADKLELPEPPPRRKRRKAALEETPPIPFVEEEISVPEPEPKPARQTPPATLPPETQRSTTEWKYHEGIILKEIENHIAQTMDSHYVTYDELEVFDCWNSLGDSSPTYRNNAIKYLWRYGKKDGNNKDDLLKAIHMIVMMMNQDHYE